MGDAFVTVVFVFYRKSKVLILTGETSVCGMKTETAVVQVLQFCDPCPFALQRRRRRLCSAFSLAVTHQWLETKKNKHNKYP